MLQSMTGYGRADAREAGRALSIEIRSINHRFLEISVRLPKSLAMLESKVRERIQAGLSRGKITCSVSLDGDDSELGSLTVDEKVAERYALLLRELRDKLGLAGDLDLATFISLPDVLSWEKEDLDDDTAWRIFEPPLTRAIDDLLEMKRREGKNLAKDLTTRLETIIGTIGRIETRIPEVTEAVRTRLHDRLAELLQNQEVEYQRFRLEAEIALFADRSDCTEECVRLRSHCQQFLGLLEAKESVGRKLTFLLQEMNREANTIGSKSTDVTIAREVIGIKEEAERLREQVANIE